MKYKSLWKCVYGTSQSIESVYVIAHGLPEAVEQFEKIYVGEKHNYYQTDLNQLVSIKRVGFVYYDQGALETHLSTD